MTVNESLEQAFPDCDEIKKSTVYLTVSQVQQLEKRGVALQSKIIHEYTCDSSGAATVYFQTLRVRTLPATWIIAINSDGTVKKVDLVSFKEPEEYLPPRRWLDQFIDKVLGRSLAVDRDIQGMTGATLSSRTSVEAVRLSLALYSELHTVQKHVKN